MEEIKLVVLKSKTVLKMGDSLYQLQFLELTRYGDYTMRCPNTKIFDSNSLSFRGRKIDKAKKRNGDEQKTFLIFICIINYIIIYTYNIKNI